MPYRELLVLSEEPNKLSLYELLMQMNDIPPSDLFQEIVEKAITLDIVIVVRGRDDISIPDRIRMRSKYTLPKGMSFLVIDDGSDAFAAKEIKSACEEIGAEYIYLDTESRLFNLSRGRNQGILRSTADYLLFEDVDLFFEPNYYESLQREVALLLETQKWSFLVFPVIYLSQRATELLRGNPNARPMELLAKHEFDKWCAAT